MERKLTDAEVKAVAEYAATLLLAERTSPHKHEWVAKLQQEAVLAERERCVKIAESEEENCPDESWSVCATTIAAAIRSGK